MVGLAAFHRKLAALHAHTKLISDNFQDFYSPDPIVTKEDLLRRISEQEKRGEELVKLATVLIEKFQKKYHQKKPSVWLVEAGRPGAVWYLWAEKKSPSEDKK